MNTAAPRSFQHAYEWASGSLSKLGRLGGAEEDTAPEPSRPTLLPTNYLVEFIAGTFGPASSGRSLTDHLQSEEKLRRIVARTNVGVMTAQDLEESSRRKLAEVHITRAIKFKHAIDEIVDHLESSVRRASDRPYVIRELFYLDDSKVALQISQRMAESHFLERLWDESLEIVDGRLARVNRVRSAAHFVDLEGRFRTELASFIPEWEEDAAGVRETIRDDKVLKIVNRMFDVFAPRMFLIGHSQGGLVALRAMQLGMRRVRVKDARRFLYSPRSGRVHRYSPVALAIGLGAPFDGIDTTPAEIDGGRGTPLRDESLPCWVRRIMPGVGQMLHGSAFLKELRGAFIPFDCSALSIANPRDGFVPLENTRLPVGDFRNMHNLAVGSRERFDVADMVPPTFRPALGLWPMSGLRKALNDSPRFEGLREHCAFLVDLGANWDVDKGEIVRQIFAGESGESLFDEMMLEVNFDGVREQLMANLLYRLRRATEEERRKLVWMGPRLRELVRDEELPFLNSIDKRAALALNYIERQ